MKNTILSYQTQSYCDKNKIKDKKNCAQKSKILKFRLRQIKNPI